VGNKIFFSSAEEIETVVKDYLEQEVAGFEFQYGSAAVAGGSSTVEEPAAKKQRMAESNSDMFFDYHDDDDTHIAGCNNWRDEFQRHCIQLKAMTLKPEKGAVINDSSLAYWLSQQQTTLRALAIQLLSTPASSAPVERVFSKAGNIVTPLRNRVKSDLLEALLKHKCNA
jgi:hypothetical protein